MIKPLTIALPLIVICLSGTQWVIASEESFDCVIDPAQIIRVSSPIIGLLEEVSVKRGDKVKKGQIIARLESSVEQRTIALKEVQANSTALIEAQKERLLLSKKTLKRNTRLAENNVVTKQEIDELISNLRINERELIRVRTDQQLAKLELERAKATLEQRTIHSPVDGIIIEQVLSAGEFVDNDSHIVLLANMDPLYVETFLPIAHYHQVHLGMNATIKPEEPIGGQHKATITIIDQVFDSASGTFGIRLELPNPDKKLPAGLRCQVDFTFNTPKT